MYQPNKPYFKASAPPSLEIRCEGESCSAPYLLPAEALPGAYFRFECGSLCGFSVRQSAGVLVILHEKYESVAVENLAAAAG